MTDFNFQGVALAPVVAAVVELLKRYANLPSDYAPLCNAVLSVALLFFVQSYQGVEFFIEALVLFVSAAGVYDLAKNGAKRFRKPDEASEEKEALTPRQVEDNGDPPG